jgi:hypothetical protein
MVPIGYAATIKKYNYSLQANTVKHRAVLSFITIGREVVDDDRYKIAPLSVISCLVITETDCATCNHGVFSFVPDVGLCSA